MPTIQYVSCLLVVLTLLDMRIPTLSNCSPLVLVWFSYLLSGSLTTPINTRLWFDIRGNCVIFISILTYQYMFTLFFQQFDQYLVKSKTYSQLSPHYKVCNYTRVPILFKLKKIYVSDLYQVEVYQDVIKLDGLCKLFLAEVSCEPCVPYASLFFIVDFYILFNFNVK